ncbi:MAG: hypothetical protein AABX02_04790, partial [archaeon]
ASIPGTTRGPAKTTPSQSLNRFPALVSVPIFKLVRFWRDYDKGLRRSKNRQPAEGKDNRPWFDQTGQKRNAEPLAITPSILGSVKTFERKRDLIKHLTIVRYVNNIGRKVFFPSFEFQPTQLLSVDIPRHRVLVRAYRAPTVFDIVHALQERRSIQDFSLYGDRFARRMRSKGISDAEILESMYGVEGEVEDYFGGILGNDIDTTNILVLDIDSHSKKPLISFVDNGPKRWIDVVKEYFGPIKYPLTFRSDNPSIRRE